MKTYKQFIHNLPSKIVVFAYESFAPPTVYHDKLIQFTQKLAEQQHANCLVFTPSTQDNLYLDYDRKMHYLTMLYPNVNFKRAESLDEAVEYAQTRYKQYTYVCESTAKHSISSCARINMPIQEAANKARHLATKGLFEEFQKTVPSTMRAIDSRHLMNDMRESMGCEPIKQQINLQTNDLREQFFKGEIYKVGDIVECTKTGQQLEIVKRGTNNLVCKSENGVVNKWLHEVTAKSTSQKP